MNSSPVYFVFPGDLDTPTGGYHYDRRLIEELRKAGTNVQKIALSDHFPFPDKQDRLQARDALAALPDGSTVVIDGLAFGTLDELAGAESQRLRLVALCHHPLALETGLDEAQQQEFMASEKRALHYARSVVTTSPHTRDILTVRFAVPTERIVVARPGTERGPFAPCDGDPLRLLTVASLIRRKAHDVLIDALDSLHTLPWTARFVGGDGFDPAWTESLCERVRRLQLSDRICFAGPRDDLQAEYQKADVFVLPSRFEGYGMVFAEALAAGLPVVAAHAGAVPDVVPETAGILVPPDDTRALTGALKQVLTDSLLRRRLQAGARKAAATLPSWADTARLVAQRIEAVQHS